MKSRKGNVLVVVLIITSFIITVAMSVSDKSFLSYSGVSRLFGENQGSIYAATAVEAFKTLMVELDDVSYDAADDIWASIPSIPVTGGYVTVSVKTLDDRLPINSLINKNEATRERIQNAFRDLFLELDYDDQLWHALRDWIAPADAVPMSNAIIGEIFNREGNSYTAKHAPLTTLEEIRLIPGFSEIYDDITQYISIGDLEPKININLASEKVIKAMFPELLSDVDKIIEKREEEPFTKIDDLLSVMDRDMYTKLVKYFDVKSTYFYVKIDVDIVDVVNSYHVLLKRTGKRISVVRYIEAPRIKCF